MSGNELGFRIYKEFLRVDKKDKHFFFLKRFTYEFERQNYRERRDLPADGLLSKWSQWLTLDGFKSSGQELNLGLQHEGMDRSTGAIPTVFPGTLAGLKPVPIVTLAP